jgi:multiple sugar transport system substrate-binding protein
MKKFKTDFGYDLAPPATWNQYNDQAKFFNNWDWNNRGKPSYGSCEEMARAGRLHWFTQSRAAAYAKHPDDPDFFFDRDTMKPRINNPGWVRAVQNFVDVVPFGPPGRINFDIGAMRAAFVSGDAARVYEWGDIGSEELKPNLSVVNGLVGSSILPGAEEVWNSKTNQWDKIPNQRAPILNFGGWTHGVTTTTKVADAAFDFAAFMGSVEMAKRLAVEPDSGINPGRFSQLGDVAGWVKYGLKESDAVPYLQAIKDTYTHPNVVFDLRVPGGSEYTDAVGIAVAKSLAGEMQPQEAMDEAAAKWEAITDRLGREDQKKAYVESMTLAKAV